MPNRSCKGQDTMEYSARPMQLSPVPRQVGTVFGVRNSECLGPVKSAEGRRGATGLTSPYNNSDAALTPTNGGLKDNMLVIRNTAPREIFGFRQWDKVLYAGQELFIKGRRLRGSFALSNVTGKLIREVSYKKLTLLERASLFLTERRRLLLPH